MATREESIQNLIAAKEFLAADNWMTGIGYSEKDKEYAGEYFGKTCLLGGLAKAFGWTLDGDTDSAISWLEENDGEALIALAKVIPPRDGLDHGPFENYVFQFGREPYLGDCAGMVYSFNDRQYSVAPVLKALEDAAKLLESEVIV